MRRSPLWVAAVVLAALIIIGSLGPFPLRGLLFMYSPRQFNILGIILTMHRIVHFLSFGALTLILCSSAPHARMRLVWCATVAALAGLIETTQFLFNPIPFETWDLRDDLIAVAISFLLAQLVRRHHPITTSENA